MSERFVSMSACYNSAI